MREDDLPTSKVLGANRNYSFFYGQLQDNGCRSRPCNDIHVCVPTFASPFYTCVPFAAGNYETGNEFDRKFIKTKTSERSWKIIIENIIG